MVVNSSSKYDLVVIGSGSGGTAAARLAASMGARVAIVERRQEKLGGAYLHANDIPSKVFIEATRRYRKWSDVRNYVQRSRDKFLNGKNITDLLRSEGIDVYFGEARFTKPNTVKVGKETVAGRRLVVASGATPHVPSIAGLKQAGFLDMGKLLSFSRLPRSLAIIGGGMSAIETAFALRNLGIHITIFEHSSHILSHLDTEPRPAKRRSPVVLEVSDTMTGPPEPPTRPLPLSSGVHATDVVTQPLERLLINEVVKGRRAVARTTPGEDIDHVEGLGGRNELED
jgi:pyruvate/2-oxoglutarate dehydrogenase complex dihydrolipoamide dehydrogenase (E3) component